MQHIELPDTGLCEACLGSGLYQTPVCLGCGKSMLLEVKYCGHCLLTEPIVIVAPCSYHQGMGPWVARLKYQSQFAPLRPLVTALRMRILSLVEMGLISLPQVLVPVPLHPRRLKHRGYNQAWLIARELSQQLGIPMEDKCLLRVLHTEPQAGLSGLERRKNLNNAFWLQPNVDFQTLALIDDVVTTGSTVGEIARLFHRESIQLQSWALARAEAPGLLDDVGEG